MPRDEIREIDSIGWITALKSASIRALVEGGQLQMGLFDERNLLELTSPDYPGERLMACRNEVLARLRAHKREAWLTATERNLAKIKAWVAAGKLAGRDAIGLRVGKIINQYKVAKHFELTISDAALSCARKQDSIVSEAALDGVYIVRTSVPASQMDASQCVRKYKSLANVERAFRSIETIDLKVRPIHHRTVNRVRAHILICMLAYYVQWHMREAWRELMFADAEQLADRNRNSEHTPSSCLENKNSLAAQRNFRIEALRDGWHRRKVTMDDLWRHAAVNRVANVMRAYLETIAASCARTARVRFAPDRSTVWRPRTGQRGCVGGEFVERVTTVRLKFCDAIKLCFFRGMPVVKNLEILEFSLQIGDTPASAWDQRPSTLSALA